MNKVDNKSGHGEMTVPPRESDNCKLYDLNHTAALSFGLLVISAAFCASKFKHLCLVARLQF